MIKGVMLFGIGFVVVSICVLIFFDKREVRFVSYF